jgi:hypothetical protein
LVLWLRLFRQVLRQDFAGKLVGRHGIQQ